MSHHDATDQALYLLHWHRNAGADCAVADAPTDWLARGDIAPGHGFRPPNPGNIGRGDEQASRSRPAPTGIAGAPSTAPRTTNTPATKRPQTPLASREAESEGRRIAGQAKSLAELEYALQAFDGCTLRATATNLCFYRGIAAARVMIIGEAPGRDEDIAGKPFVGRAGKLLDKMLASIDLDETSVHITNVVYWRPPGNRPPTAQETLACRPFLDRQIELVDPEFVVVLGGSAAKEILSVSEGIMRLRGKWRECQLGGRKRQTLATLHPAYLLRTPAAKNMAWRDLLALKERIESVSETGD